jgi:ABC-type transport system involved in multi-copper enzyme maturation permease subunit
MIRRIFFIAKNTTIEAIRNKALAVLLIFGTLVIASANFFTYLAPGEEGKIIKDVGLSAIFFFGMMLAIFAGAYIIPRELETKTLMTLLVKPVRRIEILLGRYAGLLFIIFVNMAIMSGIFAGVLMLKHSLDFEIFKALLLTFFELGVLCSITICLSTFTSVAFNIALSFLIYIVGHLIGYLDHIIEHASGFFLGVIMRILQIIIPNFENFNVKHLIVLNLNVPTSYVVKTMSYGLLYIAIMLSIAYVFFNEKEI